MHATLGRTDAEGLLAEERLAPRDRSRRRDESERGAGDQLRAIRRGASAPRRGRIEASGQLLLRRREHRREEGQRAGGAHGLR